MKLKIIAIAATIMASFSINFTEAQNVTESSPSLSTTAITNRTVVNNKTLIKFQKEFPNAEKTTWVRVKKGYEARFSNNGIDMAVGYNKAGRLDYIFEHYNGNNLPVNIKTQVNDAYKEYDIISAVEVHSEGEIAYLVNIESRKFKKVIRINSEGMDVYQDMAISSR